MRRAVSLLLVVLSVGTACSDGVGPQERALDGPWSSPLTTSGMAMAISLTWTHDHVNGSGAYSATDPSELCGTAIAPQNGHVVLTATRPAPGELRGQLTFGNGAPLAYEGTLIDTSASVGFAKIQGILTAANGATCGLTLFQGLIP